MASLEPVEEKSNNRLLAFYESCSRKNGKRNIKFKHCLVTVNDVEFIVPEMKGHFIWEAELAGHNSM